MSGTDDTDARTDGSNPEIDTAVNEAYKIRGELTESNGIGVLGQNNAASGTPVGVRGVVPTDSDGYGLDTPNDARVEGAIVTSDNHEVTVDGQRALRLDPAADGDAGNVIAGHPANSVTDGVVGASIAGGGSVDDANEVTADYGTVSGGRANTACGRYGTVVGGADNTANGAYSVVAGRGATADGNDGAFVVGDSTSATVQASAPDEVRFQASGGVVAENDLTVDGALRRDAVTQAYAGSAVAVASGTWTTFPLDTTAVDEPSALDTDTYEYTCPQDGHYRVEVNYMWGTTLSTGTVAELRIRVDGSAAFTWSNVVAGARFDESFTRTLTGLNGADTIDVQVAQDSGSSKEMNGGATGTSVTVQYLGDGTA